MRIFVFIMFFSIDIYIFVQHIPQIQLIGAIINALWEQIELKSILVSLSYIYNIISDPGVCNLIFYDVIYTFN